jgi:hypothetical protein
VMHWNPPELIDGPYLREVAWRTTCPKTQWYSEGLRGVEDVSVAFPLFRYVWESHLDASLPEGARVYIPSPWLLSALRLSPDRADIAICRDESDEVRFIASTRGADGSLAVINAQLYRNWLDRCELDCVWLLVAERSVWPGGGNENATWRRTEGLYWIENGKPNTLSWTNDHLSKDGA